MVRPARMGRSRGCAPCRKKRIKCDLGSPCQRCIDSRIHCPGPISGAFIVESTPVTAKSSRRMQAQASTAAASLTTWTDVAGLPPSPALTMSLANTPTSAVLLETFISYLSHSARKSSWTFSLPSLSAGSAPLAKPFKSALHAVALAHFANSTSDTVFSRHAALEYSRSLSLQRNSLATLTSRDLVEHSADQTTVLEAVRYALLASTVLSYYELIAAVTPTAWMTHTVACEQLLGLIGPELIGKDRILRQVAVSVRSHAITRVVIYGHESAFAQTKWREAMRSWTSSQEQSVSRDAYDWIIDFMLRLCSFVQSSRYILTACEDTTVLAQLQEAMNFKEELQSNYADWLTAMNPSLSTSPSSLPLFAAPYLPARPLDIVCPDMPTNLQSPFPAMALAHFHAAAMLLQYHFPKRSTEVDMPWNCQWLLSVCRLLSEHSRTNATAVLRMGLPFAIAWKCCATQLTKQLMKTTFEVWARREGMSGLGVVAFPEVTT